MSDDTRNLYSTLDKKIVEALLDENKVDDFYKSIITRLDEAILEIEGLVAIGATMHKNSGHYVDIDMHTELYDIMERINKKRLQYQRGIAPSVDNISFIEEHPLYQLKKKLDNE